MRCSICNSKLLSEFESRDQYCHECGAKHIYNVRFMLSELWVVKKIKKLQEQLTDRLCTIRSQAESLNEQNERIRELRYQRDLLYKYAEIHGDKFFLYAPLEKEYLNLLNEIEAEDQDAIY